MFALDLYFGVTRRLFSFLRGGGYGGGGYGGGGGGHGGGGGYGSEPPYSNQPFESDQYYSSFSDSPRGGGDPGYSKDERERERESLACVEGIAVFFQHSVQRWAVFCCHFLHLSSHRQPENSLVSIVH